MIDKEFPETKEKLIEFVQKFSPGYLYDWSMIPDSAIINHVELIYSGDPTLLNYPELKVRFSGNEFDNQGEVTLTGKK